MSHRVDPGEGSLRATWFRSDRTLARVIQPLQAFLYTEASGGITLENVRVNQVLVVKEAVKEPQ